MPLGRALLAVGLVALLLGCEREPAAAQPDVVGRWNQEGSGGHDWIAFQPGGTAVAYSFSERLQTTGSVTLQWYWVDDALMLRGAGGLSRRVTVSGDRMTMEDGTALVRASGP